MKKTLILVIINISINLITSNLHSKATSINHLKFKFDKSLEKIEKSIRNQNKGIVCIESSKAIKLIDNNINQLEQIEPYYDWEEIERVLSKNLVRYC